MTDRYGIDHEYHDIYGDRHAISETTLHRLQTTLGEPANDVPAPLVSPLGRRLDLGRGDLHLENGELRAIDHSVTDLPEGYHRFEDVSGRTRQLIIHPGRCHLPEDLHSWGWVTQLYATRSRNSWGHGDMTDLATLAAWTQETGGGFVLSNPLGAVAPVEPQETSPYFPATRRFRNPLYLDVDRIPGAERVRSELTHLAAAGHQLNLDRRIDRDAVWRLKRRALQLIWRAGPPPAAFDRWLTSQPSSLHRFATWAALSEQEGASWRSWARPLRDCDPTAITEWARANGDPVRRHAWVQWCLELQMEHASEQTRLIQDLPIGVDPDGFDAWEWQDMLTEDAAIGAPPDLFNRAGQNWSLPAFIPTRLRSSGYQPFIDIVRAHLTAGGGLRIDHVVGLFRLWMIPEGMSPAEGAYVRYPVEDLLGILALESRRAGAVVIGEDLGTVEEGVRDLLQEWAVMSYRLLWFEEGSPETWPVPALAAVTTHDLPTVAGVWSGSDVEEQREIGIDVAEEGMAAIRARLANVAGLPESASSQQAVLAAHRVLARARCMLIAATLEDATGEERRTNMPGADRSANWARGLALTLEEIMSSPLARELAKAMTRSTDG